MAKATREAKLPTPVSVLWEGILVVVIVGVLDSKRTQETMETILEKVSETQSKTIIMDILGVPAVDTAVANHLIKITKATKLMGCECIISGISPVVAQALVNLGVELSDITTHSNLRDALQYAFEVNGFEVRERKEATRK